MKVFVILIPVMTVAIVMIAIYAGKKDGSIE